MLVYQYDKNGKPVCISSWSPTQVMPYQYNAGYWARRAWEKYFPTSDDQKVAIGLLGSASIRDAVSGSETSCGQNVVLSLEKNQAGAVIKR